MNSTPTPARCAASLPPCDADVLRRGSTVFFTHSIESIDAEIWVCAIRVKSDVNVDWHYVGGRIVVLALGDLRAVIAAMNELMPMHDAAFKEVWKQLSNDAVCPRPHWWRENDVDATAKALADADMIREGSHV